MSRRWWHLVEPIGWAVVLSVVAWALVIAVGICVARVVRDAF